MNQVTTLQQEGPLTSQRNDHSDEKEIKPFQVAEADDAAMRINSVSSFGTEEGMDKQSNSQVQLAFGEKEPELTSKSQREIWSIPDEQMQRLVLEKLFEKVSAYKQAEPEVKEQILAIFEGK